jgi:phospholipid/cholesterol/gamma-HCH transport system substrate-binding protein
VKLSKEVKTGLLVTGAIAALLWGMNYLKGYDLLSDDSKFFAVYSNVDGLVPSSDVVLNGVKVGMVQNIQFTPDNSGRIVVDLVIKSDVFISKTSVARIISTDLLGSRGVSIVLDPNGARAEDGDTLASEVQTNLADQLSPVKDKAESLIQTLDSLAYSINLIVSPANRKSLDASFVNLDKTLANLESVTGSLDKMVSSDQGKLKKMIDNLESITSNIKNNNEALASALQNIEKITDSLAASNLTSTVNNANSTLSQTASIMEKINKGEGTIGMLINNDSLYRALEQSAVDLDKLLIDLRENPKRYVHISVFGSRSKSK